MRNAETVTFGGSGLERAAELRSAPPEGGVLPFWRGKPLMASEGEGRSIVCLEPAHAVFVGAREPAVFLGLDDGRACHARDISHWEPELVAETVGAFADPSEQQHPALPKGQVFAELRAAMTLLGPRSAEIAATGKALLEWHATHPFCAKCGAPTEIAQAGWQRTCSACGAHHFPRTDPVVIMLITQGNDVLVGRSPGWPEGMFSLLAGFVEPGESLEAAVRREVREEAGVEVGSVEYLASQPWPFPTSLMVGCRGVAASRKIVIDPVELDDARWISREEMVEVVAGRRPDLRAARRGSIARFLIERWLADRLD